MTTFQNTTIFCCLYYMYSIYFAFIHCMIDIVHYRQQTHQSYISSHTLLTTKLFAVTHHTHAYICIYMTLLHLLTNTYIYIYLYILFPICIAYIYIYYVIHAIITNYIYLGSEEPKKKKKE
jgi:hypothetical protein